MMWYNKRKHRIKVSTFGLEFVTSCVCWEIDDGLWYKLCMIKIPVEGSTNVYCDDNESVVRNATIAQY